MWRVFVVAISSLGCGRIGFDVGGSGPSDAADAVTTIAAVGPLLCGAPRVIAEPAAVPVGVGLVATTDGVLAVWTTAGPSAAAGIELDGVQLSLGPDAVTAGHGVSSRVPIDAVDFGLVSDGAPPPATRFMLSSMVDRGSIFVALDAALQPIASTNRPGVYVGRHAVAAPAAPGGRFFAGWLEGPDAAFSALDAAGAPTGTIYRRAAEPEPDQAAPSSVSVQHADARDVAVWRTGGGCAVWAFDDATTTPVISEPRVYAPSGACARSTITRHPDGINLLAWVADAGLNGQLGTDTTTVGGGFRVESAPASIEIATAPRGFFLAAALSDGVLSNHVRSDGTGATPLAAVPHVQAAPFRLVEHGRDALLLTVGLGTGHPQLLLTRLCEPT